MILGHVQRQALRLCIHCDWVRGNHRVIVECFNCCICFATSGKSEIAFIAPGISGFLWLVGAEVSRKLRTRRSFEGATA